MKKWIGLAAMALLAAGCSGSSGTSTSTSSGTSTTGTNTTGANTTGANTTGTNTTGANTTGANTTGANTTGTNTTGANTTGANTTGTNTTGTNTTGANTTGANTTGSTTTGSTTTGSSGNNGTLTGALQFNVGRALADVYVQYPDGGGQDDTIAEIDLTDDATDSCQDDYEFPDGGVPAAENFYMELIASDPNGVQGGTAYNSLTADQWDNVLADGGGAPDANAQIIYFNIDTGEVDLGVSGTVTFNEDSSTQEPEVSFTTTMGTLSQDETSVDATNASALSGNAEATCAVGLIESQ